MTTDVQPTVRAYVVPPDEGKRLENLHLRLLACNTLTGGQLSAAEIENPGPGGPPMHTHREHDEFYLVLTGRYRFKIGEEIHEGGAGTFAYVPRGASHTFASVGPEPGRLFGVTLPGLEQFLERMSLGQEQGIDQREMFDLFRQYDSEIDGPPLV